MTEMKQEKFKSEDTLSAKPTKVEDSEHVVVDRADVPLVSVDDIINNDTVDLQTQKPLFFGDFKNLTTERLQNYIVVITAIEKNLAEYKGIRKDLTNIFDVVWKLNEADDDEGEQYGDFGDLRTEPLKPLPAGFDIENFGKKGDILSNLMELGKQNLIDTTHGSLKDMVKEAAKLLDRYRHEQTTQEPAIEESDSDNEDAAASER